MTPNFSLRKLEEKDIPGMLEWMHDPEVNRWFRFDADQMTAEKARNFIAGSFTETNRHYAIVSESDEYLGTVSLENIDMENRNAVFAMSMRRAAWGTGIAVSVSKKIQQIAFEEMGLERIYLNTLGENNRAKKFFEKAGFHYEGTFRKHLFLRGTWYDWDWFSVLKDEYYAGND